MQGTGLGLSICKSIVERLGGRIEVSSELGQGSTFALYLPYQEIPVEVAERSLSTKIDSESVRHKKILVVEDIESNFAQLNILLKKEYTILWVRNGHAQCHQAPIKSTGQTARAAIKIQKDCRLAVLFLRCFI